MATGQDADLLADLTPAQKEAVEGKAKRVAGLKAVDSQITVNKK